MTRLWAPQPSDSRKVYPPQRHAFYPFNRRTSLPEMSAGDATPDAAREPDPVSDGARRPVNRLLAASLCACDSEGPSCLYPAMCQSARKSGSDSCVDAP